MMARRKTRPLRIAIAPDSFKGTMTAAQAAQQIQRGFRKALPDAAYVSIPMADGGEGTVSAIVSNTGGRYVRRTICDPLGRPVRATFGVSGDGETAVIEMASASGLTLLTEAERNPLKTGTYGTGELIRHALDAGVSRLVIGIGGSATVDGGVGMAQALGGRFLDSRGRALPQGGGALARLARIDVSGIDPRLAAVSVRCACDVTNPLTGVRGAAQVYGPQKGASPAAVKRLDQSLRHLARIIRRDLGVSVASRTGAGAAGGLGAGLLAFAQAELCSGVELVMQAVDFGRRIKDCDLVITGEGCLDRQTLAGKTPTGVAAAASRLGVPVMAISGCVGEGFSVVHPVGVQAVVPAVGYSGPTGKRADPKRQLRDCAEQCARLLRLGQSVRCP